MPAVVRSTDASNVAGTSEADGRRRWPRRSKNDRYVSRISSVVMPELMAPIVATRAPRPRAGSALDPAFRTGEPRSPPRTPWRAPPRPVLGRRDQIAAMHAAAGGVYAVIVAVPSTRSPSSSTAVWPGATAHAGSASSSAVPRRVQATAGAR